MWSPLKILQMLKGKKTVFREYLIIDQSYDKNGYSEICSLGNSVQRGMYVFFS